MQKFMIFDWTGSLKFDGKGFNSFESAEEYLSEYLGDTYETDRQEYEIMRAE